VARRDELASDFYEQLAAAGSAVARERWAMVGRTVRGAVDDLLWRREVAKHMQRDHNVRATVLQGWWAPVATLIAAFEVGVGVRILIDNGSTQPGRVIAPALALLAALATAAGLRLRIGSTSQTTTPSTRIGQAALVASLVLLLVAGLSGGGALLVGAFVVIGGIGVLAGRNTSARRTALANGLLLLGMLPALTMFWMAIPPLLAAAVIAGVLTSSPRVEAAAT
jgi:hypothetical protein